jgi:ABC-type glycerol-3-phosphate transport system substrate-binding protein
MRAFALGAVLALVAAGCAPREPADVPAGVDEDLSGVTLEVAAVWTGEEQRNFEQVLAAFEEATGATVNYTSTGDDIAAVLGSRIAGGNPPDVAMLPQPGLLRDFARQGALESIEDIAGDLVDAHYAPTWRELGTVDGELYGVWFKAANKSLVWYNTAVFEDAGVSAPETWDDFIATARTISEFGVDPISVGGADGWTLTDWFENVYLRTAGPELYDQLTNHEIPWTHESVREALEVLAEAFDPELMAGGTRGALQTDFVTSVTQVFTDPPRAAMVYEGDFVAGVIAAETGAELGVDAGVFEFPSIGGAGGVVGGGDVAVLLRDSEGGRALMRYLASPAAGEVWAGLGGFISPNVDVDLGAYPDEITRSIAEALAGAEVFRFDLSDLQPAEFGATVGQGLFRLFQDFLANPADIDGVTQRMEQEAAGAHR